MTVINMRDPGRFEEVLPQAVELLRSPEGFGFYVGKGKDGWVYHMVDPTDLLSNEFEGLDVKIWVPGFTRRRSEIEIHRHVFASRPTHFRVPELVHADTSSGAFVMEHIRGMTAYRALFHGRRLISESLYDSVLTAFRELNVMGVHHGDAHLLNWMLEDIETIQTPRGTVITDADVVIIDFGRSSFSHGEDVAQVREDIEFKVVLGL